MLRFFRRVLGFLFRLLCRLLFFGIIAFLLQASTLPIGTQWYAVAHIVSPYQFDYLGWEAGALLTKAVETLWGVHAFMDETARSAYVRAYFADLAQAQSLDGQINAVFTDPAISDPQTVSADLRAQRDTLRADLRSRQPLVEAILEGQVAAVLVDEGFGVAGQLLPPIAMHFTRVPNLVVVSPRDTIRMDISINVNPMTVDEMAALEERIEREQDVSALIVPLGGMALYPAMILETSSLTWAVETFAHEWLHHYLYLFPLGLQYDFAGETRIINETVADWFGKEISHLVIARYYPDLLAGMAPFPPPPPVPVTPTTPTTPSEFDFGFEMNATRVHVDELLAAGEITEAERYMQERRALFASHGYRLRRLNQAFFAFYGGYQAGNVPGVGGEDPIGPGVRNLRAASVSAYDFVLKVRGVTTRAELLALVKTE